MKKYIILGTVLAVLGGSIFLHQKSIAAESGIFQTEEYITIRWSGRENTHLIRSNGKVEMLGKILMAVSRPDRTDERSFFMNIAMNAAAKEGYEFAGMTNDEIVMKRKLSR
jgi:hypothetical protein